MIELEVVAVTRSILEGSTFPFVKLPVSDEACGSGVDREAVATDLSCRESTIPEADFAHVVVGLTIGVVCPARISKREVLILTNGSELKVLLLLVQLPIDVDRERTVSTNESHVIPLIGLWLNRSRYTIVAIDLELEDITFPATEDEARSFTTTSDTEEIPMNDWLLYSGRMLSLLIRISTDHVSV